MKITVQLNYKLVTRTSLNLGRISFIWFSSPCFVSVTSISLEGIS